VGQIADFIEEQCSPVSPLESAELSSNCPSEGPFLVSEQFALDQVWIERRTVDVHERFPSSAAGLVYAARDEFFASAWLANDEDAQVEARGNHDIPPDFPHQFRFADEFVDYHRVVFTSRQCSISMQPSSGKHLDAMRSQMSGVFELAYNRAVHWLIEPHNKMGLSALNTDCEFTDSPGHGKWIRRFEFALQPAALDSDTVQMDSLLSRDLCQIL